MRAWAMVDQPNGCLHPGRPILEDVQQRESCFRARRAYSIDPVILELTKTSALPPSVVMQQSSRWGQIADHRQGQHIVDRDRASEFWTVGIDPSE